VAETDYFSELLTELNMGSVAAEAVDRKTWTPMPLSYDRAGGCAERENPPYAFF
jgi:hypothetical protein